MNKTIDVRSDTVTKPTAAMIDAMFKAKVGDDVFGEDETVNKLQEQAANMFGFEAALFCPSGTMTNQLAIKLHTQPGDEVICDKLAHIYNYEGGGIAFHSGASVRLVQGNYGIFSPNDVLCNINKDDPHFPRTSLVCIENTVNKGGGAVWTIEQMQAIAQVCKTNNLRLHLDGARIFNAIVAANQNPLDYALIFDTISICLSKGLGAPVGSLLLGNKQHIAKAKRLRKLFGGGMRQAGYLAAAGIFALNNHISRLKDDHEKAKLLANHLGELSMVAEVFPCPTNIVIFKLQSHINDQVFLNYLNENQIKATGIGQGYFRFVMHLDVSANDFGRILDVLTKSNKSLF
jgi:threonine aldolase